jgi:hypothetical protein
MHQEVDIQTMSTNTALKVLHDRLLADKPEGVEHDKCELCELEDANHISNSGGPMPEPYTQEEVEVYAAAAAAAATSDLQKRLAELSAQLQETEVGQAVAQAVADREAQVAELQAQLDTAQAARTAAETKLAETDRFWSDAIAEHERQAAFAARREVRIDAARQAAVFSEDYIVANADRFASMSDEDFAARLGEWQLIASSSTAGESVSPTGAPASSALLASRADEAEPRSALAYIGELRNKGVDPRTLGGV